MTEHDKPTLRDTGLMLDRLADDEVDALAGIVDAVLRHVQPVPIGDQHAKLDRLLRKLRAERERRGLPPWAPAKEGA